MAKLLEKVIKDAMDDKKCSLGAKEVIGSMKNSKLIILSQSIPKNALQKIQKTAMSSKVPTLNF
jgi:large subunit ribosomal protein L30e